jgi:hypothetical protein
LAEIEILKNQLNSKKEVVEPVKKEKEKIGTELAKSFGVESEKALVKAFQDIQKELKGQGSFQKDLGEKIKKSFETLCCPIQERMLNLMDGLWKQNPGW